MVPQSSDIVDIKSPEGIAVIIMYSLQNVEEVFMVKHTCNHGKQHEAKLSCYYIHGGMSALLVPTSCVLCLC